jgi:hypothetical protein
MSGTTPGSSDLSGSATSSTPSTATTTQ